MDARQISKPQHPDPEELDHEPRDLQDEDVDEGNPTRRRTTDDAEDLQDADLDEGGGR